MSDPNYKDFYLKTSGGFLYARLDDINGVEMIHLPCGKSIFGSDEDPTDTNLSELLFIAQAHSCAQ